MCKAFSFPWLCQQVSFEYNTIVFNTLVKSAYRYRAEQSESSKYLICKLCNEMTDLLLYHSFHDGSLNFYQPYTLGYYSNSRITGLNSPKVSIRLYGVASIYWYQPSIVCCMTLTTFFYHVIFLHQYQVLQVARNYFGCEDLPYVPLENNGGSGSERCVRGRSLYFNFQCYNKQRSGNGLQSSGYVNIIIMLPANHAY